MIEINLTPREITATGLYIMRWKGRTGMVRIVGEPKAGWRILKSNEKTVEVLMPGMPADGSIPMDALLSEPLALSAK